MSILDPAERRLLERNQRWSQSLEHLSKVQRVGVDS